MEIKKFSYDTCYYDLEPFQHELYDLIAQYELPIAYIDKAWEVVRGWATFNAQVKTP